MTGKPHSTAITAVIPTLLFHSSTYNQFCKLQEESSLSTFCLCTPLTCCNLLWQRRNTNSLSCSYKHLSIHLSSCWILELSPTNSTSHPDLYLFSTCNAVCFNESSKGLLISSLKPHCFFTMVGYHSCLLCQSKKHSLNAWSCLIIIALLWNILYILSDSFFCLLFTNTSEDMLKNSTQNLFVHQFQLILY